jgi:hypothetical protein
VQETSAKEDEVQRVVDVSGLQKVMASQEDVQMQGDVSTGAASADFESSLSRARGGGSPLGAKVRGQMESAMGADFSGVKIHTDNRSDQLNRSIQAKAFTTGNDIFFQQGAYNPSSSGGQALIAHELTHTVQQGASTPEVQRIVDEKWTNKVEDFCKSDPESLESTTVQAIKRFNEENFSGQIRRKAFIPTEKQFLQRIQKLQGIYESLDKTVVKLQNENSNDQSRFKSIILSKQKRQERTALQEHVTAHEEAVIALRTEVENEMHNLSTFQSKFKGKFRKDIYGEDIEVDDSTLTELGKGQVNTVYKGSVPGFGDDECVWKADETQFGGDAVDVSGLTDKDVRLGNRNIAMYRLDQLLQTGVIPETKRAHRKKDDAAGTLMKFAAGTSLIKDEVKTTKTIVSGKEHNTEEKYQVAADINYENSNIQRDLSNIQLLDSICGQVDRHGGNIIAITSEDGQIISLQGIDNDFAFGTKIDATTGKPIGHHRGFPEWIDKRVADRIRSLESRQVMKALEGLLSDDEILKTIERFETVKAYIEDLDNADKIVDKWTKETYDAQMAAASEKVTNKRTEVHDADDEIDVVLDRFHALEEEKKKLNAEAEEERDQKKIEEIAAQMDEAGGELQLLFKKQGAAQEKINKENPNADSDGKELPSDFSRSYLYEHAAKLATIKGKGGQWKAGGKLLIQGTKPIGYEQKSSPPPTRSRRRANADINMREVGRWPNFRELSEKSD